MEQTKEYAEFLQMTKKPTLSGRERGKKLLDMEAVYQDQRNGMTQMAICDKYKVSRATLVRRHKEYQEQIKQMEKKFGVTLEEAKARQDYEFPSLPDEL